MPKNKPDNVNYFQAEFKAIPFEDSKSVEAGQEQVGTTIKGYASTPTLDRYNDVVEPEAFRESIQRNYKNNPIILFQHNNDRPIGKATFMSIDHKGLYIEAMIVDSEIEPKIKAGILKTFSIGYIPKEMAYQDAQGNDLDPADRNDLQKIWYDTDIKRIIKKVDLVENSVVSVPANPDAIFTLEKSVKSFFAGERKKLEDLYKLNNTDMDTKNLLDEETKEVEEVVETPETPEEVIETPADETSSEVEGDETSTVEEIEDIPETPEKSEDVVEEVLDENTSGKVEAGIDASLVTAKNLTAALTAVVSKDAQIKELEAKIATLEKTPSKQALVYREHGLKAKADQEEKKAPTEKKGFKDAFIGSVQY